MKNKLKLLIPISILIFGATGIFMWFYNQNHLTEELNYNQFMETLKTQEIKEMNIIPEDNTYAVSGQIVTAEDEPESYFTVTIPEESAEEVITIIEDKQIITTYEPEDDGHKLITLVLDIVLIGGIFWIMTRGTKTSAIDVSSDLNNKIETKFDDVIGYEEEKQELIEIIDFLKNPKLYHEMGAKIPNGVLLEGPPGTGKTLMAKAVAGEAGVPFYSISGSDFIEMYVGVGASRVRSLFKEAKKNGPCIIFIDEIDAIGSRDSKSAGGGNNSEQEQTINALLVEMDGFSAKQDDQHIIIMAATNRSEKLDAALLRPGRFDRKVVMGLPEVHAREDILKFHAKKRKVVEGINFKEIAKGTTGMSGAQLESIMNEAAILAVRHQEEAITQELIEESIDRVLMGPAKISNKYSAKDKELVAYHETGHAIIGLAVEEAMQVQKITIVPRGDAGGYVAYTPKDEEERFTTKEQLEAQLMSLVAGRASEEMFLEKISVGGHNDFERATVIARAMVTRFGMSELGMTQYELDENDGPYTQKQYSEATAVLIDQYVEEIIKAAYNAALDILAGRAEDVHLLAKTIQEEETLTREEIYYLLKNRELKK